VAPKRQIKPGLSMRQLGYHAGGWRHPDVPAGGAMDIQYYARVAQTAERGLFDMVFLADGLATRIRRDGIAVSCGPDSG
jgi:alkanesulfonate monooxygenase SsuD/methylene tetrahydromethanopterin reductase-like flavin-dependent oxidoreductase (luciferase family)